jgi:adenylosuccinate lyase
VVYGHLWSTPETLALLDEPARFQSWLEILAALAEAQAEVGLVPQPAADAVRAHADVRRLDLAEVAARTRATGHSTLGLIQCLQDVLPKSAREWVYYGATVQDLTDTWTSLVMQRVGTLLDRDLARLQAAALSLARTHRDTVMCGRTHGQPGLPVTFGFKAAVWASELGRHRERLKEGRARWEVVQLGGALGTLQFFGDDAVPLLEAFGRRVGLRVPDIAWITARDRVAEFATWLAMVAATLGKVGNEVYQLQRPEIGELSEPFTPGQVGSITMPHKRNPELSEHLGTLARLVRADASVAVEGMVHEHERDGRAWKAEWLVLPEACLLTATATAIGVRLLEGLEVHADRMRANLDAHGGYVLSERLLRVLSARLGKHAAHQVVYAATMGGLERGASFADTLRKMRDAHALGFSTLIMLYVAVEVAIYVWMPTYLQSYTGSATWLAAYALTIFFVLRAAGRFLGAWFLRKLSWSTVLVAFAAAILCCFAGSLYGGPDHAVYLLPLSGLFMSVLYPTLNSKGISCFPRSQHGAVAGVILFFTAFAAAVGPLAMGAISDALGDIKYGFVLATGFAALLFAGLLINRVFDPAGARLARRDDSDYVAAH